MNKSLTRNRLVNLEDSEIYDYFRSKGINNRLEIKIAPDQEKLNVQDLKDLLKSFDYQLFQQNSYSKQSLFKEVAKSSNKSLVEKARSMAEYYWDIDYVLSMIKRLPEFQKKEINFQVLMEFVVFLDSYFNNSRIELLDPEFDILMKKRLKQIHSSVAQNSIDALPFISQSLDKIKKVSRERMIEVKALLDDPNQYYSAADNRVPLHQLVKLPKGDVYLLTDPKRRMIYDIGQRDFENYTSECMFGYLMKNFQIGTSPVLEYFHKNYKLHYYTTDMNEMDALEKGETGHGGWSYEGIVGYVFPNRIANTVPIFKYYNQNKNLFFYTPNLQDMTPSLSGQICFLRPENNNPIMNKFLGQAFDIGDQFILLGTLGFIYPAQNCWEYQNTI